MPLERGGDYRECSLERWRCLENNTLPVWSTRSTWAKHDPPGRRSIASDERGD